ncbi:DegT/DnrJ/EryC1/StrS family aminotransferase [Pedobacter mucosus]|uniref:DegT/DnrJ/EryC1/StrS family aminotransferase n=1 Tax=Pedobacter mucosus TaxID=2895286 RepID=UPI001EE4ABD3|nr:DegT/DnrJ/EryC1/StrS family aminotransferase [Pedobacter mucosus]UKT63335.1 DegT/DnrJ/EryC1/StrS family aminotransferase [Pedobacter mucosus]
MNEFIPVNTPLFTGNEKKYLNECIDTGWVSSEGAFIKKFEHEFSRYCNRKHGIAVSNGSAALDIAVKAIGIKKGDEVILPTFTIISPALSIIKAGGIPVYVDSEADTWNMDVDKIEACITDKTKAIVVVHIYGLPVEMDKILNLASKYNLRIIEDAAEMHGQTFDNKICGSFGDISIFSFYANKTITTGEGGMIVCDDDKLAEKCKKYRNLSFEPDQPRFMHFETGWNYRMTNMQAALGLAQLEQIDNLIIKKRAMGAFYQNELKFLKNYGFDLPLPSTPFAQNIYWVFGLVAPTESEKIKVLDHLKKELIGTRPFFWCMHEQPLFISNNTEKMPSFPIAEKLARCGFYIPSGLGLTEFDMKRTVNSIKKLYA